MKNEKQCYLFCWFDFGCFIYGMFEFWVKVIDEYTKGEYKIIRNAPEAICEGGALGHVMVFET